MQNTPSASCGPVFVIEILEQFDHGLEDGLRIGPVPSKGLLSP
jgi:hypothetical protein